MIVGSQLDALRAAGVNVEQLMQELQSIHAGSGFIDPRCMGMVVFSQSQLKKISEEQAALARTMSSEEIMRILRENPSTDLNADIDNKRIRVNESGFMEVK